jgi:hypothetical protein
MHSRGNGDQSTRNMSSAPYNVLNGIIATLSTSDVLQAKSGLLTLHFLFPHELLPALDLLDRKLVTRMKLIGTKIETSQNEVYYVQSASATTSRPSHHQSTAPISYEVRLSAWNCTCPAFAYSAFGKTFQTSLDLDVSSRASEGRDHLARDEGRLRLGGMFTQADSGVPTCKHILAAFLGAAAPQLFGNGVCEENMNEAEAAGWAGGWGD